MQKSAGSSSLIRRLLVGTAFNEGTPLELGMRFEADRAGRDHPARSSTVAGDAGDTHVL